MEQKQLDEQMAKDVVTFLAWAAEPHLEARHRIGFKAIIIFNYFNNISLFKHEKIMVTY